MTESKINVTVNRDNLRGRVAFVTGGGRGIGEAIALALADNDVSLALCALEQSELESVKRRAESVWSQRGSGARCIVRSLDIRNFDLLSEFAGEVEETLGPVDIVVANAGITDKQHRSIESLPVEVFREIVEVNLIGGFHTLKAFLPRMGRRNRGNAVIVTSLLGQKGFGKSGEAGYCASKFGLEGLAEVAAEEYRPLGVNVNTVFPAAMVDTGFFDYLSDAERSALERPEIICDAVLFLCGLAPGSLTRVSLNAKRWNSDSAYRQELIEESMR